MVDDRLFYYPVFLFSPREHARPVLYPQPSPHQISIPTASYHYSDTIILIRARASNTY